MNKQAPSIFNDVIGPVMRGASSSHVAGAARIGKLLRQAAGGKPQMVRVYFDVKGSLAESHTGHGTDMGFACGILDIPLTNENVDQYEALIKENGVDLEYIIGEFGLEHPNHYRIEAFGNGNVDSDSSVRMDAVSVGGGMIEVIALNECPVSIEGDYYELCLEFPAQKEIERSELENICRDLFETFEAAGLSRQDEAAMAEIKGSRPFADEAVSRLKELLGAFREYRFEPILPTKAAADTVLPFETAEEMLTYNKDKNLSMWELAALYESTRGHVSVERVLEQMTEIVHIMKGAVAEGLRGTSYEDRILHEQCTKITEPKNQDRIIPGGVMNKVIQYITAVMEAKSSMKVIVASPTAGSCGCLPGTLIGTAEVLEASEEELAKAFLAAGLIGVFFAGQATFAAEVGGCQMECGAGSGMAAGGLTQLMGGTAAECVSAASMALQGITGLACDPVANRVEVPCLFKNVMGGMNAISSTNMALSGFDCVIPLDETIKAIYDIGLSLPLELRCTYGGLGKTVTSNRIRAELESRKIK